MSIPLIHNWPLHSVSIHISISRSHFRFTRRCIQEHYTCKNVGYSYMYREDQYFKCINNSTRRGLVSVYNVIVCVIVLSIFPFPFTPCKQPDGDSVLFYTDTHSIQHNLVLVQAVRQGNIILIVRICNIRVGIYRDSYVLFYPFKS